METFVGGYSVLRPFDFIKLPLNADARKVSIREGIQEQAFRIMIDELDLPERTGFILNVLTTLPAIGLSEFVFELPDHFIPEVKISAAVSLNEKGYGTISQLLSAIHRREGGGYKNKGIMYTESANRGLQFSVIEFAFNDQLYGCDEASLVVAYPLKTDYFKTRVIEPPRPLNGRVRSEIINRISRESLLEFLQN